MKYDANTTSQESHLSVSIQELSDKIGKTIEKIKTISDDIQEMYDGSHSEYDNLTEIRNELRSVQREADHKILSYKRKIADLDNELNNLRGRMREIQEKLNQSK